jgi:hypothetical protein
MCLGGVVEGVRVEVKIQWVLLIAILNTRSHIA